MLFQRRNDDNTCTKLTPVQLHGSNGGGRHIIGFNIFLIEVFWGLQKIEMRNLESRVDIYIFSGFRSDKGLFHHRFLRVIMAVGNSAGNI
jgi:hypothetical protein